MTDDGGVLGNLPNSRPGRRSAKRPETPQGRPAPKPRTAAGATAKPAPEEPHGDPISDAIRTATGIAGAGARVANGVARELVRRLPRI